MALSYPSPCLINFDRSEDSLIGSLGMENIMRDRIVAPVGEITYPVAKQLLTQFEADVNQAKQLQQAGVVKSLIIDGGPLAEDIITIVTLEENDNKNNTYRYATRNAYITNLFNDLNESGLNAVWLSKAKPLWVNNNKVAGQYIPNCHDDIPFMVNVNIFTRTKPKPPLGIGLDFFGVIGMNSANPAVTNLEVASLDYTGILNLLWPELAVVAEAEAVVSGES